MRAHRRIQENKQIGLQQGHDPGFYSDDSPHKLWDWEGDGCDILPGWVWECDKELHPAEAHIQGIPDPVDIPGPPDRDVDIEEPAEVQIDIVEQGGQCELCHQMQVGGLPR